MLVKPQSFRKGGRYPTAQARAEYLERDGRAVELATWNISDEENWAREMDRTSAQHSLRGSVVGREYVLSPGPDDRVTPLQMRDFALAWASRNFSTSEVAVVVHEDNRERLSRGLQPIPHAHVYVNAPDLETSKKLHIDNARARELHDSAQRMSRELGWSAQEQYWDGEEKKVNRLESACSGFERRPQWQRSARLEQEGKDCSRRARAVCEYEKTAVAKRGVDFHEYRFAKAGRTLDKTIIRRGLKEAIAETGKDSSVTLKDALGKRGIVMERASRGEFKYRLAGSKLAFKGKTLGPQYARDEVRKSIEAAREIALGKGAGKCLSL